MISLLKDKHHLPILLGLSFILIFFRIFSIPLTDGDSAFYVKIARNIVETGDWLTMHYGDPGTIINKPPLMMWMTAVSFKIFGINDFAVCFWHGIFALLTVLTTYKMTELIYNKRTAFISSIILLTSAQFFYMSRSPLQDIPLTLFVLLSVYLYLLYERSGKSYHLYLSSISVALTVLSKGPVGLVLSGLVIGLYILLGSRKFPSIKDILISISLFSVVALPWYIIEYRILGSEFLNIMIGSNLGRYFKPIDTIGNEAVKYAAITPQYDFYSYALQLMLVFVPWSGLIYPSIIYSFKKKLPGLPLIFFLAVLAFFSFSLNYKISRYILPALPALSILIGKMLSDAFDHDSLAARYARISAWVTAILVTIPLLISFNIFVFRAFSDMNKIILPMAAPFLAVLIAGLIIGSGYGVRGKHLAAFFVLAIASSLSYTILLNQLSAYFPKLIPVKPFCEKINTTAKQGDIVCQYRGTDAHFMIYYSKFPVVLIRNEKEMLSLIKGGKKVHCIVEGIEAYNGLEKIVGSRIRTIERSGIYSLITN